jgi:transcription antitermination factor NusG
MTNDNDDIQDLITQLKDLQLQQAELIVRLERARGRESRATAGTAARAGDSEPRETRELAIGDRVRIKNPGPFQANRGVIIKIGTSRITVRTRSGSKIIRAPKNLTTDDE